jgi:hypothetical protein
MARNIILSFSKLSEKDKNAVLVFAGAMDDNDFALCSFADALDLTTYTSEF